MTRQNYVFPEIYEKVLEQEEVSSVQAFYISVRAFYISVQAFYISVQAFYISVQAFYISVQAFYISVQAFYISVQAFYISVQAFYISVQAFYISSFDINTSVTRRDCTCQRMCFYLFTLTPWRPTRKSQRDIRQRGGLVVVIVVIMILIINKTLKTLAGYSNSLRNQATSKLTSLSAVLFVQGYRLEYVCCGFVQAQAWRWSAVRLVLPNV
jgi:hypothetical protein